MKYAFPNKIYVCIICNYVILCVYVDVDVHTLWVLNRPAEDPAIFQAIQARCGGNRPVGDMDAPEDLRSVRWLKGWLRGGRDADLGGFVVFFLGGKDEIYEERM